MPLYPWFLGLAPFPSPPLFSAPRMIQLQIFRMFPQSLMQAVDTKQLKLLSHYMMKGSKHVGEQNGVDMLDTTQLGRFPEAHELFTYTYTCRHDGSSWIEQHSQSVEEEYTCIIAEIESEQSHAFFQAVGVPNNRNRIYGLGAAGHRYFSSDSASSSGSSGASTSATSSNPNSHIQAQLGRLQATVDDLVALQQQHGQEEQNNHTDRLNMGTSSSQMADVQQRFDEFEVQMRDQIGVLQNMIVRMQQQIDRLQPQSDQT